MSLGYLLLPVVKTEDRLDQVPQIAAFVHWKFRFRKIIEDNLILSFILLPW